MPACHAGGRGFEPLLGRHVGASFISLAPIFYAKIRVRSCRCSSLFAKGHAHAGYSLASALITPLTRYQPFARCASGTSIFRSSAFSHKSKLYIACSDFLCKKSEFAHAAAPPYSQRYFLQKTKAPLFLQRGFNQMRLF